jgi:hypothetical protein
MFSGLVFPDRGIRYGRPDLFSDRVETKSLFLAHREVDMIRSSTGEIQETGYLKVVRNDLGIPPKLIDELAKYVDTDEVIIIASRKVTKTF